MELSLSGEEAALLKRILGTYVSELQSEIGKTDKYDWRQSMKADEAMAKAIIDRLGSN